MKVVEIFKSIEGEGPRAGLPVAFIRLHGCNLRCSYCDTKYSYEGKEYEEMPIWAILAKVAELGVKRISVTGGEPLIHKECDILIKNLLMQEYDVSIETNGSVCIREFTGKVMLALEEINIPFYHFGTLDYVVDYKSHSSGQENSMVLSNLDYIRDGINRTSMLWKIPLSGVYKFVVGTKIDLRKAHHIINNYGLHTISYFSPSFEELEPKEIVEYVLQYPELRNCRVQLQLHKYIWKPEERGV